MGRPPAFIDAWSRTDKATFSTLKHFTFEFTLEWMQSERVDKAVPYSFRKFGGCMQSMLSRCCARQAEYSTLQQDNCRNFENRFHDISPSTNLLITGACSCAAIFSLSEHAGLWILLYLTFK